MVRMANKNFVIRNQNQDGTWDVLYPRTSAQQVVTSDEHQFISAAKIAEFEAKASKDVATTDANGLMSKEDKAILDGLAQGLTGNLNDAKAYTDQEIAKLVDGAPEAVNTLAELATALQEHEDEYDALLAVVGDKATKTELTEGLALKADLTHVDGQLALKADQTAVDSALALKVEKSYVDDQLALKANAQETTDALAAKASKLEVTEGLALKADLTFVNEQLALKADKTQVALDIAAAVAGTTQVIIGESQPLTAKPGDFWYEIVS